MFVTWQLHQWIPILKFQRKINEGVLAKFSVDTGSAINTLNLETFEEIVKKSKILKSTKMKTVIHGENDSSLKINKTFYLNLKKKSEVTAD